MTPAARAQAAIELVGLIEQSLPVQGQPADQAIRSFFKARRYAGARDRAAVTELVYGVLRRRAEWLWCLGTNASPRLLIATQCLMGASPDETKVTDLFDGSLYGPERLTPGEADILQNLQRLPTTPPPWVAGNYPEWLDPYLTARFGDRLVDEIAALNQRAPLDLRANILKANRQAVQAVLAEADLAAVNTPWSPLGLRAEARTRITGLAVFKNGLIEVQDEGSQVAALLVDARQGMQVVDLCAGAGGKTLILSATMQNKGQVYAVDADRRRLRQMAPRIARAGVRNLQTLNFNAAASQDVQEDDPLSPMDECADRVLLDVPCSGTGAWRRNPDAKWRLTPDMLSHHVARQDRLLARAASLTKPGGRLIYVTCSVLEIENEDRIGLFLKENPAFKILRIQEVWTEAVGTTCPDSARGQDFLLLTPRQHGTDGFFVAVLERKLAPTGG
jgi:16S rRNA (cytosine967-C5)-methyltransferase